MLSGMYQDYVNQEEGFIRLTAEEVRQNLPDILKRITSTGVRIVVQQSHKEVAAIIPIGEFERLEYLKQEINSSPYQFDEYEYEYYEDEGGIQCVTSNEVQAEFERILTELTLGNKVFGLLAPTKSSDQCLEFYAPVAILMSINKFWIPEYLIIERNRLWTCG